MSFKIPKRILLQASKEAAKQARRIVIQRTKSGSFAAKGSSGVKARRYHPRYAKQVGKPIKPVDLTLTGAMLNSIRASILSVRDDSIEISLRVSPAQEWKRDIHENRGAGRGKVKRVFMYLNKKEKKKLLSIFKREVVKRLKKTN